MEGPSLVIACEEFARFRGKRIRSAEGTAPLPFAKLRRSRFGEARSWGKHFLLRFDRTWLRIHFLMFGSYRINDPRANRVPKLELRIGDDAIYFYSCAIREIEASPDQLYDWSIDVMSPRWDARRALRAIREHPRAQVCDILMDQAVFAGVGNIIKNEVLFRRRLHPATRIETLSAAAQRQLVSDARAYSRQFYRWKKKNVLKRNWQIFRKKECPVCGGRVTKAPTGKGLRISHFCRRCQPKPRA